jgi:hypothetical protein
MPGSAFRITRTLNNDIQRQVHQLRVIFHDSAFPLFDRMQKIIMTIVEHNSVFGDTGTYTGIPGYLQISITDYGYPQTGNKFCLGE